MTFKLTRMEMPESVRRDQATFNAWVSDACAKLGFDYVDIRDYVFTGSCYVWDFVRVGPRIYKREVRSDSPVTPFLGLVRNEGDKPSVSLICQCGNDTFRIENGNYARCTKCGEWDDVWS